MPHLPNTPLKPCFSVFIYFCVYLEIYEGVLSAQINLFTCMFKQTLCEETVSAGGGEVGDKLVSPLMLNSGGLWPLN